MTRFEPVGLPGLLLVMPAVHGDERGFFVERWKASTYRARGIGPFLQANRSRSARGVLRGLHWQVSPHAQGKLVSVAEGEILDVAVDLRRGSPSFGRWASVILRAREHRQLWVPPGFAHGFLVRSAHADVLYESTAEYAPDAERGLAWDDPEVGVDWGGDGTGGRSAEQGTAHAPTLSTRDRAWPRLRELRPDDLFAWKEEA